MSPRSIAFFAAETSSPETPAERPAASDEHLTPGIDTNE